MLLDRTGKSPESSQTPVYNVYEKILDQALSTYKTLSGGKDLPFILNKDWSIQKVILRKKEIISKEAEASLWDLFHFVNQSTEVVANFLGSNASVVLPPDKALLVENAANLVGQLAGVPEAAGWTRPDTHNCMQYNLSIYWYDDENLSVFSHYIFSGCTSLGCEQFNGYQGHLYILDYLRPANSRFIPLK